MIGYVAATTHRGIRHIRVPTTVLAQNDSGVGVKNGVNAFGMKNLLGTFAPPFAVLNDFEFLRTLQPRDKIAGIAEAVKVALIRDGCSSTGWKRTPTRCASSSAPRWRDMIRRCAELHMRQIAHGGDPFETGSARPLDYGHWSAHKLEALTPHEVRHGEAVAIGLALDTRYSVQIGMLAAGGEERVIRCSRSSAFTCGIRRWRRATTTAPDDPARHRGVPRASGRRAHHHAACATSARRGSARHGYQRNPARHDLAAQEGTGQ